MIIRKNNDLHDIKDACAEEFSMKQQYCLKLILGLLFFSFVAVFAGCGSDGGMDGDNGGASVVVSFSAEIQPIFRDNCTICHKVDGIASFLPMTYEHLVNRDATNTDGGGKRVIPFDAANSILYQRISGIGLPLTEETMPLGSAQLLPDEKQVLIQNWINEGALDN